jgi:preprotein translocase subunit SecG
MNPIENIDFGKISIVFISMLLTIITYSILFLLMIKVFFKSHTNLGMTASFSKKIPQFLHVLDEGNFETICQKVTWYVSSLWILINITLMVLTFSKVVTYEYFVQGLLITSIIIVSASLGFILFLYCKFSGIPYVNRDKKRMLWKMAVVYGIWTIALDIKNIPTLFIKTSKGSGFSKDDFQNAILLAVDIIVTEVIPYLLALESSFIEMFTLGFRSDVSDSTHFVLNNDPQDRGRRLMSESQSGS